MTRWTITTYEHRENAPEGPDGVAMVWRQTRPMRLRDWLRPVPLFLRLLGSQMDPAGRMGPGLAWSVACGCAGIERRPR